MENKSSVALFLFSLLVLLGGGIFYYYKTSVFDKTVNPTEANTKTNINKTTENPEVILTEPAKDVPTQSPLIIKGKARGAWFFEGQLPFKLLDLERNELASGTVTALEEWTTADYVPFEGILEFKEPQSGKVYLVISKDNPSGLPESDKSVEFQVILSY